MKCKWLLARMPECQSHLHFMPSHTHYTTTHTHTLTHTGTHVHRFTLGARFVSVAVSFRKYCLGQWCNNYFDGMWCEHRLAVVGVRWLGIIRWRWEWRFYLLFVVLLVCFCLSFWNFSLLFSTLAPLIEIWTQHFGHDVHGRPSWWLSLQLPHFVSGRLVVRAICNMV